MNGRANSVVSSFSRYSITEQTYNQIYESAYKTGFLALVCLRAAENYYGIAEKVIATSCYSTDAKILTNRYKIFRELYPNISTYLANIATNRIIEIYEKRTPYYIDENDGGIYYCTLFDDGNVFVPAAPLF